MTPMHDAAVALLMPIWRGIPSDYKSQYKHTIWDQFENQVRSAAYTSTISRFLSRISSRLRVSLADVTLGDVAAVCESGHDREILRILREESAYVVTLVRIANDERKQKGRTA